MHYTRLLMLSIIALQGIVYTVITGFDLLKFLLVLVIPIILYLTPLNQLWILGYIVAYILQLSYSPEGIPWATILLSATMILYVVEPIVTRLDKKLLKFYELPALLTSIAVPPIIYFYTRSLGEAMVVQRVYRGLTVLGEIYSSPHGHTILYLIGLLFTIYLFGKVYGPKEVSMPRRRKPSIISRMARHIVYLSLSDTVLFFNTIVFLFLLAISIYVGGYGVLALIASYVVFRVLAGRTRYSLLVAATTYLIIAYITGIIDDIQSLPQYINAYIESLDKYIGSLHG